MVPVLRLIGNNLMRHDSRGRSAVRTHQQEGWARMASRLQYMSPPHHVITSSKSLTIVYHSTSVRFLQAEAAQHPLACS